MRHRDPETGQYVSGARATHWDDYEFVHVSSEYGVSASDLPGSFPIAESDIRSVSLDDIMDRDERADLVAVFVHALQASVTGTSSAESSLETHWELHAGVGDELVLRDDRDYTADTGSSGVVSTSFWESDSPDPLYHAHWVSEASFADSSSGVGGGADAPVLSEALNYPREFGSCPTFDDRDEITESLFLANPGSANIDDSQIDVYASYTLVFGVHERD